MRLDSIRLILVLPLLLVSMGFTSSGREGVTLSQIAQWSDAILLVSKRKPYLIERRYKVSDSAKEEYETKEFVIFIRYNEMSGWFSFTAGGAMESKDAWKLRKSGYPNGPNPRNPK